MDPLLIERWTGDHPALPVLDEASLSLVRGEVRAAGAAAQMDEVALGSLLVVVSELGMNQLVHGRAGVIAVVPIEREGVAGVEIVAADRGAGIADPIAAIEGTGPKKGLGVGLSGSMRLAQEVDLDIRLGQGLCVRARVFAGPVSRRREVVVFGRACKGERLSGDDATFVRRGGELLLGLADGLGHGPEALTASSLAIQALHAHAALAPEQILERAALALARTRGAVMSVARLDEASGHLGFAGVGNVSTRRYRADGTSRSFSGPGFVLGLHQGHTPRVLGEHESLDPRDVLVMFSDGLSSRARVPDDRALLRQHPIFLAQRLFEHFARDNDDATVLVAG